MYLTSVEIDLDKMGVGNCVFKGLHGESEEGYPSRTEVADCIPHARDPLGDLKLVVRGREVLSSWSGGDTTVREVEWTSDSFPDAIANAAYLGDAEVDYRIDGGRNFASSHGVICGGCCLKILRQRAGIGFHSREVVDDVAVDSSDELNEAEVNPLWRRVVLSIIITMLLLILAILLIYYLLIKKNM